MLLEVHTEEDLSTLANPLYSNNMSKPMVKIFPTEELYKKIAKLHKAVVDAEADYIESFDNSPEWYNVTFNGENLNPECSMVKVAKDTVHFDCIVKHTNVHIYTTMISIKTFFNGLQHLLR